MKQLKIMTPAKKSAPTSASSTTTRQEIDEVARKIGKIIEKDPKKAAKAFEAWLQDTRKKPSGNKAA
jgi:flavorubredoxin